MDAEWFCEIILPTYVVLYTFKALYKYFFTRQAGVTINPKLLMEKLRQRQSDLAKGMQQVSRRARIRSWDFLTPCSVLSSPASTA